MTIWPWRWSHRASIAAMTVGVCVSVSALAAFGYRAVLGWHNSSEQLASRRAAETADLLVTALTRDMRAVQTSILASPHWDEFMVDPPYDTSDLVASAFARYPYPEVFFGWRGPSAAADRVLFFTRSDRLPHWLPRVGETTPFPVTVRAHPALGSRLVSRIEGDTSLGQGFSIFEMMIDGNPYQVVARILYYDALRDRPAGVFGFMVNLDWVRANYFSELATQVARIGTTGAGLDLAVIDDRGQFVTSTEQEAPRSLATRRAFALAFFEPRLVLLERPRDLPVRSWIVQVAVASDPALAAAEQGANLTLLITALSALMLGAGLLLTGRAARANARLVEMRSEFVSTVTHELKTPIATIRAAGDTLASGRVAGVEASRDYARIVVQEAKRLTRLVDNLLAYARITDVADVYSFEPLSVDATVAQIVERFRPLLTSGGFEIHLSVQPHLPPVLADRTALQLLLDNLVDNAIRYSSDRRWLAVRAGGNDSTIRIEISDHGVGIPVEEIGRVTRRFVRGRQAPSGGSGLGLAIASRIAKDHQGTLSITSTPGEGTTVTVTLPTAAEAYEETDTRR